MQLSHTRKAELIKILFGATNSHSPKNNHVLDINTSGRHLANTTELSILGYHYCSNLLLLEQRSLLPSHTHTHTTV